MPHFESRRVSGNISTLNGVLDLELNGDDSATVFIDGGGPTLTGTYSIQGSIDGVNFFNILAFPFSPACNGGTIPVASQPIVSESLSVASARRVLSVATGQLKTLRVIFTALTAGSATVWINADACAPLSPYVVAQKGASLVQSVTGALSAAVTATLPAVAGLRHYIDSVSVVRSAGALLVAAAAPVVATTTNLPGSLAFTFGQDAAAQGLDKEQRLDAGGSGMAAVAASTATTIVCPIYTNVIWRVNVLYRLGL